MCLLSRSVGRSCGMPCTRCAVGWVTAPPRCSDEHRPRPRRKGAPAAVQPCGLVRLNRCSASRFSPPPRYSRWPDGLTRYTSYSAIWPRAVRSTISLLPVPMSVFSRIVRMLTGLLIGAQLHDGLVDPGLVVGREQGLLERLAVEPVELGLGRLQVGDRVLDRLGPLGVGRALAMACQPVELVGDRGRESRQGWHVERQLQRGLGE